MDIITAVEFVGAVLLLIHLDLNAVVVELVLFAEHPVTLREGALLLAFLVSV